jgi:hypothetical protein
MTTAGNAIINLSPSEQKSEQARQLWKLRACSNERSLSSHPQPIVTEGFTSRLVGREYIRHDDFGDYLLDAR